MTLKQTKAKLQKILEENIRLKQDDLIQQIRLDDTMGCLRASVEDANLFKKRTYNLCCVLHEFLYEEHETTKDFEVIMDQLYKAMETFDDYGSFEEVFD